MGVLEPTDAQIERMVHRAAAWDDAVAGPSAWSRSTTWPWQFYADQVDTAWAGPTSTSRLPGWRTHPHSPPGYAPAGWTTLVDHLGGRGVTDDELLEPASPAGPAPGDSSTGSATGPSCRSSTTDQILGFVGRRHPDLTDNDEHAGPKYLNTADTALFHKGAQLYGVVPDLLERARSRCSSKGPSTPSPSPSPATAATSASHPSGTALTDEQARSSPPSAPHRSSPPTPTRPDGSPPNATSGSWPNTEPTHAQPNSPRHRPRLPPHRGRDHHPARPPRGRRTTWSSSY